MSDNAVLSGITDEQAWMFFEQSVGPQFLAMLDTLLQKGRTPEWILEQNISIKLSPIESAIMAKAMRFREQQIRGEG